MNKEEFFTIKAEHFDCGQIFTCGQCFRWHPDKAAPGWWTGVVRGRVLKIKSDVDAGTVSVAGCSREEFDAEWRQYFDLDTDYGAIGKYLSGMDEKLAAAVGYGSGIRILRQEPFEMLISFIISANNNIPRITKCIETLSRRFGEEICVDPDTGEVFYAFPTPEALAAATPEQISEACHLGYRCPYIVAAAQQYIDRGGDLSDPESYTGVGPKVASCIRLFTGADTDAFPVDVWVRRLITELYFPGAGEPSLAEINQFIKTYFTRFGGYAQQYLFFWRRGIEKDSAGSAN
ncbi:MAG: hypothetical protein II184_04010 [Clostridia bacterium]|nr:hypothetical protein [Clostridia bacterium]MBQ3868595.1 hypothetical protein [Clostridia bacterium]